MKILVLNAGSSSQKTCLYDLTNPLPKNPPQPVWEAQAQWSERPGFARLRTHRAGAEPHEEEVPVASRRGLLEAALHTLWSGPAAAIASPSKVDIVGHRVVHGGPLYYQPIRVTQEVRDEISRLALFAPQHNPANVEGIDVIEKLLGETPQVAVFDTAFHHGISPAASTYGGPYSWVERGLRRYGFHGINHQYCVGRAALMLARPLSSLRLITCHLGNGCSLAAIRDGRSVDTTMGFTPLDGLVMGSRSGSVDPGILIHLIRNDGATATDLDRLLNKESGLKGISGLSGDMRIITKAMNEGSDRACLAFDVFVHRLRWHIGAMLASAGPLDALVFTGGIGENSPAVRTAACEPFAWMGIHLDPSKNEDCQPDEDISQPNAPVRVLVIHAEEDWSIARECFRLLSV